MANYEDLFDEDKVLFGGTPDQQFWNLLMQMPRDRVQELFDEFIAHYATIERILSQQINEDELDDYIKRYQENNREEIENYKKSVYLDLGGQVISKMPQ